MLTLKCRVFGQTVGASQVGQYRRRSQGRSPVTDRIKSDGRPPASMGLGLKWGFAAKDRVNSEWFVTFAARLPSTTFSNPCCVHEQRLQIRMSKHTLLYHACTALSHSNRQCFCDGRSKLRPLRHGTALRPYRMRPSAHMRPLTEYVLGEKLKTRVTRRAFCTLCLC